MVAMVWEESEFFKCSLMVTFSRPEIMIQDTLIEFSFLDFGENNIILES